MNPELVIIVPSRGRPQQMREFLKQWHRTKSNSWVALCVDDDDETLNRYPLNAPHWPAVYKGPRRGLAWWTNQMAIHFAWDGVFAVASVGDDHRLEGDWEAQILGALHEMGTGIVYGDDGFQGENRPTACFMTADIVRTLGWMCVPGCEHMEIDVAWKELGEAAGVLRYLPHVKTPHLHPLAGKADWDESYRESNSEASYAHDIAVYRAYKESGQFDADVARIKALKEGR